MEGPRHTLNPEVKRSNVKVTGRGYACRYDQAKSNGRFWIWHNQQL